MSVVFNVSNVTMPPKARNCQLLKSTSSRQFCDTEICSQALIIALTSDFIPRMYFLIVESPMYTFEGYVNSTLAVFETSGWGDPSNSTSEEIRGSREAGFTQPNTYVLLAFPDYFGPDPEIVGNDTYALCRYKSYRWEIKMNAPSDSMSSLCGLRAETHPEAPRHTSTVSGGCTSRPPNWSLSPSTRLFWSIYEFL